MHCENLFKNRLKLVTSNTFFRKAVQIFERLFIVQGFLLFAIAMMVYVPFILASTCLGSNANRLKDHVYTSFFRSQRSCEYLCDMCVALVTNT